MIVTDKKIFSLKVWMSDYIPLFYVDVIMHPKANIDAGLCKFC